MVVQLSSLRVSADMDPAKYVAGMNAKVASDRAGAASSIAVGQAITQTNQKVSASGDPLVRLSRQYVEGFRGAEQFNRAIVTLGRGIDTGNVPLERAGSILDGIYRKYGMTANSAEVLQRGQVGLAVAVDAANVRFESQRFAIERAAQSAENAQARFNGLAGVGAGSGLSARDSASVFEAELSRLDDIARLKAQQAGDAFAAALDSRLVAGTGKSARDAAAVFSAELDKFDDIARMRAQQVGASFASDLNARLGIGLSSGSARDSAAVFEEAAREADGYANRVAALRTQIDPLGTAQNRLNAELAEYQGMASRAEITTMELAQAQGLARARFEQTTTAMRAQNDNGGTRYGTANIAAQFQDIGVTSAMGMSPIMIALQQGTQLSAELQRSSQGLRGTIMSLGGAFASILSPVSLLTIGVIALGAVGIQALMGIGDSSDDASSALETHKKWLDEILYGYDAARKAANDSAEAAQKLPQGVVQSDLQAGLTQSTEDYADAIANAARKQVDLNALTSQWVGLRAQSAAAFPDDAARIGRFDALIEQAQQLATLEVDANSTTAQLESVMSVTRQVMNTASEPAIKNLATEIYNLAAGLRAAQGEISTTQAALAALQGQAFRGLGVDAALKQIVQMTPDLRTSREVVSDLFSLNAPQARTMSELQALANATSKFNTDMTEQERRQQALKDARSGGKTVDQWGSANDNFQQRIDQTNMEIAALGQSTYTAERNKAAFDLLNQAKSAGIPITSAVTASINTMADEYATAQVALERQTEAIRRQNEEMSFYRGTFGSFFLDFKNDLMNGASLWDAFANAGANALNKIADRAIGMAADGIFDMIFGAFGSAFGGGGGMLGNDIGKGIAGMFGGGGLKLNALGNVYQSPDLSRYSNSIVSRPTMFAFANGAGLMGEAGPEAILPLKRMASGHLGVAANTNTPAAANYNGPLVQIFDQRQRGGSIEQQQVNGPHGEKMLRLIVRDEVQQARLRGAVGF